MNANGSPIANANVTFTVTKANGSAVKGSAITDATGSASYTYRLNKKDPVGVYQARADANLNNAIFGSATASFTVQ